MPEKNDFVTECDVNGKHCHIFGNPGAGSCIVCGMGNHTPDEITDTAERFYEQAGPDSCHLILFETDDWNGDFSP